MKNDDPQDLARAIATPALMGQHLGAQLLGTPYRIYPWVQFLERKVLANILAPGRKIIIVSVPPQNGKTTYFGLLLPMWYLGMNPFHQVMFISYNEEQAGKWGMKTRDAMKRWSMRAQSRAKLGDALPLETLRGSGYKLRAPDAEDEDPEDHEENEDE